ncbi:MAG: hypothetical protein H5U07_01335 [Candidatus Aminicenantes bacterium]|nr:hypothetical protein [Candidatus Aminicenantes bacterium]
MTSKAPDIPFHTRNHSEDRKHVAIYSLLPVRELVTSSEINGKATEMVIL